MKSLVTLEIFLTPDLGRSYANSVIVVAINNEPPIETD